MLTIYNETVAHGGHVPMLRAATLASVEMTLSHSNRLGCPVWVLLHEGHIVGWAHIRPIAWGGSSTQNMGEFSVYVTETWRGRGVAAQAVFVAYAEAIRHGYTGLTCWILSSNHKSIRLARGCRMKPWGLLPRAVSHGDRVFDLEIWGCQLDDADWVAYMNALQSRLSRRAATWLQEHRARPSQAGVESS